MALTKATKQVLDGMDTTSLTQNGYQKLPGGLIMQWGYNSAGGNQPTVTFPIAFPTACLNIMLTREALADSSGVDFAPAAASTLNTTSVLVSNANGPFYWLALGY